MIAFESALLGFCGGIVGCLLGWIATLAINVTGSFLLGVVTGLGLDHGFPRTARIVLGVGFCGAYTTFSTFTYETVELLEETDSPNSPAPRSQTVLVTPQVM